MKEPDHSLTVVVTRLIRPGCEEAFERAMKEFIEEVWAVPGHLGMQMLRPAEGNLRGEYTILARFDSLETRSRFISSEFYRGWMDRLDAHSFGPPVVRELDGMEGWFALAGHTGAPPKWKMALTVWVGVYLVSQLFFTLLGPLIHSWPRPLQALPVTGLVVAVLTWLVLPPVTRALRGWYFPKD